MDCKVMLRGMLAGWLACAFVGCSATETRETAHAEPKSSAPATATATEETATYTVGGTDYHAPRLLRRIQPGDSRIWSIAFSPDGRWFASGAESGLIRLWEKESLFDPKAAPDRLLDTHTNRIYDLDFGQDGRLASSSRDGNVILWEPDEGDMVYAFTHPWEIRASALSPDGKTLIAGQLGGTQGKRMPTIHVWNLETGERTRTLEHTAPCADVSFSPDGVLLALGFIDGAPSMLVDSETGDDIIALGPRGVWANAVTFDPTGRRFALATVRSPLESRTVGVIRVWDAKTGLEYNPIEPKSGPVGIVFSPDGNYLAASLPDDKQIVIWHIRTREIVATLSSAATTDLAFSPDGRMLAACSPNDGSVELWVFGGEDAPQPASAESDADVPATGGN
ncbi:MAG: WD40 repeat domain-containing protein [Planctomycetota bacterium]